MSTPDNDRTPSPATPPSAGGNVWKANSLSLTLSMPAAKPPSPGPEIPLPPPAAVQPEPGGTHPPLRAGRRAAVVVIGAALLLFAAAVVVYRQRQVSRTAALPRAADASPVTFPLSTADAAVKVPAFRALVIGINRYAPAGADGWQPLQSARADAEAVAGVLASDYGFSVQTLLDGDATRAALLNALDELATSGPDGADLIYFAGHGFYDETLQEGYWIPADARKTVGGRPAKEDWLWNSTLTRLINASRARHVLVLSDACYSGSLFRGDEPLSARGGQAWYERAIAKPSRYLISSGGNEPVLDSGAGHSVFAQEVLTFLTHGDKAIFSANDLGAALRERVAALTGQMVHMGPLPVSGHAGGEFVFIRRIADQTPFFTPRAAPAAPTASATRGPDAPTPETRRAALRDALALTQAGAPKAANTLVAAVLQQDSEDRLARAVAAHIDRSRQQEARDELRALISQLEARKAAIATRPDASAAERPRVLACLGPAVPQTHADREADGLLYRLALSAALESRPGVRIVEREALAAILQEQNLGASDLADPGARVSIGKLLPASLLLLGDLLPTDSGEKIFLRLVDTETTQILASFTAMREVGQSPESVTDELAGRIAAALDAARPAQAAP